MCLLKKKNLKNFVSENLYEEIFFNFTLKKVNVQYFID